MRKKEIKLYFIFIGIGLLFAVSGVLIFTALQAKNQRYLDSGIKTNAVISDIILRGSTNRVMTTSSTKIPHDVYVTFNTYDGVEVTAILDTFTPDMHRGNTVEIYYDPMNPDKVTMNLGNNNFIFLLVFGFVGFGIFMIGFSSLNKIFKFDKLKNKLINSGYYIMADITEVIENQNFALNNMHPYNIHSKHTENDKDYNFKSHNIWFKPSDNTKKVKIYLDKNDYNVYYVDEDSLK